MKPKFTPKFDGPDYLITSRQQASVMIGQVGPGVVACDLIDGTDRTVYASEDDIAKLLATTIPVGRKG